MDLLTLTVRQAKDWLRQRVMSGEAHDCPLCDQRVQVYKRKINSRQARTMIEVYRAAGTGWCHVPSTVTYTGDSGEISKLRYWGLVVESTEKREDGGRAGWWSITPYGEQFIRGDIRVPKYVLVYNGRRIGMDDTERISIREALGDHFDYDELMRGG